jgi:hypothetical protein
MAYGLFADIFTSTKEKEAVQKLEDAKIDYQLAEKRLKKAAESLYYARKSALKEIEDAESKLKRRRNFSINNVTEIAVARASVRNFTEIIQNESNLPDTDYYSEKRDNLIIGTTIGTLGAIGVGMLGRTAMATFGSLLFPLGAIVGGLAMFAFNTNDEYDKINKQTSEIKRVTDKIQQRISEIEYLTDDIVDNTYQLNKYIAIGKDDYQKIIEIIKSLCVNINKRFDI